MACYHSTPLLLLIIAVTVSIAVDIASAKPRERGDLPVRSSPTRSDPTRRRFASRGCSSFGHSCFGGHGKRADEDFLQPQDYDMPADKPAVSLSKADIVPLLRQWLMTYRRSDDAK